MKKRFVAVVAGLAVAVSGLVVSAPEVQAASLSGTATSAVAGQPMLVKASGFGANKSVQFVLSGPQNVSLGALTTNSSGAVNNSLTVPSSTVAGSYTLTASGPTSISYLVAVISTTVQISSPYRLLRFDANSGSVSPGSRSALSGAALGSLPTPSRAGYTFKGWFTARSGGAKVTSASRMGSTDTSLFAHWTAKKYTVKFSANGGKKPSAKSKRVTMGHSYGKLPSVKRTGYSFLGWFTAKSGGVKVTSGSTFTKAANQSLFAHWKAKSYKVKLKAQGGKVSKSSIRVTYHATYKSLPTPSRSGYSFKGWYTKKSGGTKITNSSKVKITKTQTLYAHWKKNKTYVSYLTRSSQMDCDLYGYCTGGGGPVSMKVIVTGAKVTITICEVDAEVPVNIYTCTGIGKGMFERGYSSLYGTRHGARAVVSDGKGSGTFSWGVVTFSSSKASAKAIKFVSAHNCQRLNGTYGDCW